MFELAWEKYSKVDDPYEKSLPGKDQVPYTPTACLMFVLSMSF